MGIRCTVRGFVAVGAAVTVSSLGLLAGTSPVSAEGPAGEEGPGGEVVEVSGDFTGTAQLLGDRCFLNVVAEAEGVWSGLGPSTLTMDFCNDDTIDGVRYTISEATFEITADAGTLSGSMTGWVDAGLPLPTLEFPYRFELEVHEGTGSLTDATGTLTVEGVFGPAASPVSGSVSGTLTLPWPVPGSIQDCRDGGWQDVVDDHGEPFRNQGQCISFVRRS